MQRIAGSSRKRHLKGPATNATSLQITEIDKYSKVSNFQGVSCLVNQSVNSRACNDYDKGEQSDDTIPELQQLQQLQKLNRTATYAGHCHLSTQALYWQGRKTRLQIDVVTPGHFRHWQQDIQTWRPA
jgi:hypothetical protein